MKKITNRYILKARRKRIVKRIFIVIIFLIIIGVFIVNKTDIFLIDKVVCTGDNLLTKEYILDKAENLKGENIFYINKESIIKDIKRNPYVKELTIKRVYPNKVEFNVKEAKGLYYININEKYGIISSSLILLEEVDSIEGRDLIELRGVNVEDLQLGDKITENSNIETVVEKFYDMEQVIKENGEDFSITALDISNINHLKAYIGSIEILLGTDEDIFKKMSDAVQVYKNFEVTEKIDVSFNGTPDYK